MEIHTGITNSKEGFKVRQLYTHVSTKITNILDDGKQKNAIPVLDGVRAIACLIIIFFHANVISRDYGIWQPIHDLGTFTGAVALAGECGVQLFFVLSGFLLFLPYARALLFDSRWPSIRSFYLRRIFRIVPAYYVCLFCMILLFHREYFQPSYWNELWLFLTFRMDFNEAFQHIDGPFWTLAVEFQFYILLPLLALAIRFIVQRGSVRRRMISLMLCMLAMVVWAELALYWGQGYLPIVDAIFHGPVLDAVHPYIYSGKGKALEVFAIGMVLSTLYVYTQNASSNKRWQSWSYRLSPFILGAGLSILFFMMLWHFYIWYFNYAIHAFDPYRDLLVHSWVEWQGLCYGIGFGLCIFALLHGPATLRRPLEIHPLRWIGLISFSLYMWHVPLMDAFMLNILPHLKHHMNRVMQYGIFWVWIVGVILSIVVVSYLFVEKPGMKLGRKLENRWLKKQPRPAPAVATVQVDAQPEISLIDTHPVEAVQSK